MNRPILAPRWRNALLSLHIISTVGVLGADLVILTLALAGLSGTDPLAVYPAAELIGTRIVAPLAVASLVTGVLLALTTGWGLFTYWWTTVKLGIGLALTAAVYLALLPAPRSAATAAMAGERTSSAGLLVIAPAAASTLLVLAVVLGVFKPRRRVRADDPATRARTGALAPDPRQGAPSR
jgi:hypothetical protein